MMRESWTRGAAPWRRAGEPWPPRHRQFVTNRRARAWFFRRLAFAAVALFLITVSSMFAAAWLIAGRIGTAGGAAALGVLILVFCAVAVAVAVFGGVRRIGSPLHAVMAAADRVAGGDYSVRVNEYGPPPMRALAHSFNTMTERLQHADRLRRDVMADVAHELRTPLTVLQGRLEGLIDGVYPRDDRQLGELLDETRVLSRLVEDLRTLALSDAGVLPLQKEATDLTDLVRDAVRSMRAEADRRSVSLVVSPADTLIVELDPARIREVLTNLLSNAVRHSATGGSVTVSLRASKGDVAVIVHDTGTGMSAEEVRRMFDRFYKSSASRGSGLGLPI